MIPFNDTGEALTWAMEQFPGCGDGTKLKDGTSETSPHPFLTGLYKLENSAFSCIVAAQKWTWYITPCPNPKSESFGKLFWCGDQVESAF